MHLMFPSLSRSSLFNSNFVLLTCAWVASSTCKSSMGQTIHQIISVVGAAGWHHGQRSGPSHMWGAIQGWVESFSESTKAWLSSGRPPLQLLWWFHSKAYVLVSLHGFQLGRSTVHVWSSKS